MLFDLFQVATDLGCQMESLLNGVQSGSSSRVQQASRPATSPPATSGRQTMRPALGRHRERTTACGPLDLSTKPSSCEQSESNLEINNNNTSSSSNSSSNSNSNSNHRNSNTHEETPLNLVKSESNNQTISDGRQDCASSISPSSCSIFSSSSRTSSAICDIQKPECDNNNNNNNNFSNFSNNYRLDESLASNEVQISSTNGRQKRRRRSKKSSKGARSHPCQHCGRAFSRSDMLTRHSRLHSGLKPYQCAKCLQVFSRSDHLSTHERTHTGEKPYQCNVCSYSACRRDMITRHMRTHTIGRLGGGGGDGATSAAAKPPASSRTRGRRRNYATEMGTHQPGNDDINGNRDDDVSTSA